MNCGAGSTLCYNTGESSAATVCVPHLKSITLPTLEVGDLDTTSLDTDVSGVPIKTYKPACFWDHTELQFEALYDSSTWTGLYSLYGDDTITWTVTVNDTTDEAYSFMGYLKKLEVKVTGPDQLNMITGNIRMVSAPEFGS